MAVITPVGSDFNWSPKETKLEKTASTEKTQPKTDKDLLFEAAQKVVKAQSMGFPKLDGAPCDPPCDDIKDGIGEIVKDVKDVAAPLGEGASALPEATEEKKESDAVVDVQKAVQELVDKADKAEEVATKVQDAVTKVEEAVQEVKDAVGAEEVPDEVEIEIEDMDAKDEDVSKEKEEKTEEKEEKEEVGEEKEEKDDEIVQESCTAESKSKQSKSASSDDLIVLAKLSPSTKRKIYDYWKNDLKYAPDYCKLLVTDN